MIDTGADNERIAPDIVVTSRGRRLLIEIYVTHRANKKRIDWLTKNKQPAIEIDLSKFLYGASGWDELKQEVLFSTDNKKWLYNQKIEMSQQRSDLIAIEASNQYNQLTLNRNVIKRSKVPGAEEDYSLLHKFLNPTHLSHLDAELTLQTHNHPLWHSYGTKYGIDWDNLPEHLDASSSMNNYGFKVHKKLWHCHVAIKLIEIYASSEV